MHKHTNHGGNMVYFLGFIGAAIYFIGQATSFWMGVVGIVKAFVWPAIFVYYVFQFLF